MKLQEPRWLGRHLWTACLLLPRQQLAGTAREWTSLLRLKESVAPKVCPCGRHGLRRGHQHCRGRKRASAVPAAPRAHMGLSSAPQGGPLSLVSDVTSLQAGQHSTCHKGWRRNPGSQRPAACQDPLCPWASEKRGKRRQCPWPGSDLGWTEPGRTRETPERKRGQTSARNVSVPRWVSRGAHRTSNHSRDLRDPNQSLSLPSHPHWHALRKLYPWLEPR